MDWPIVMHAGSAIVAGTAAAALVIGAIAAVLTRSVLRRWLDRLLLVQVLAVLLATLVGPLILASGVPIPDPLHPLYAAVALVAAPVARAAAMRDDGDTTTSSRGRIASSRLGRWLLAGGLLTLGALLRLWMTGG